MTRSKKERERLILSHTGLVFFYARPYASPQLPVDDLVQEGIVGLIQAVDKWDEKQTSLATFAAHRIKGAIKDAVRKFFQSRRRYGPQGPPQIVHFSDLSEKLLSII